MCVSTLAAAQADGLRAGRQAAGYQGIHSQSAQRLVARAVCQERQRRRLAGGIQNPDFSPLPNSLPGALCSFRVTTGTPAPSAADQPDPGSRRRPIAGHHLNSRDGPVAPGYTARGVNYVLAGRQQHARLAFPSFYDSTGLQGGPEVDRRTGAQHSPVVSLVGGMYIDILAIDGDLMRARHDGGSSECSRDILFHRTRVMRGPPEHVSRKPSTEPRYQPRGVS